MRAVGGGEAEPGSGWRGAGGKGGGGAREQGAEGGAGRSVCANGCHGCRTASFYMLLSMFVCLQRRQRQILPPLCLLLLPNVTVRHPLPLPHGAWRLNGTHASVRPDTRQSSASESTAPCGRVGHGGGSGEA